MQITWFFGCFFAGYLVFIKFAQITWCVLPGGPDYLVFRKFAQITRSPKSGGTRLPGPLLPIKWTRLPGKFRLPERGPEYLVSTKKRTRLPGRGQLG